MQRVSAILLVFLAGFHLWRLHMAKIITLSILTSRWELLLFVVLDLLLLAVGLFHGLNGLYAVLVDLGLKKKSATTAAISLCIVGIVSLGLGGYALLQLVP